MYPARTNYLLQASQLVLNAILIGAMGWVARDDTLKAVYTDGTGGIPAVLGAGIIAALAAHNIVMLFLQIFVIEVRPIARICVNCVVVFPGYVVTAAMAGWGLSVFNPEPNGPSCYLPGWTRDSCHALTSKISALFIVAIVTSSIGAVLSLVDLATSARLHHGYRNAKKTFIQTHGSV